MSQEVKIQFLYHSGFKLEIDKHIFIFDYWKGEVNLQAIPLDQNIFVFSSHNHPDHYNPAVLSWQKDQPDIKYILSSDITIEEKKGDVYFISPYEEIQVDDVRIKAFGSTDIGVSFLVQVNDMTLFHAGDLNWWDWIGEPEEENAKAGRDFKAEIAKIKAHPIDIAFFPVDQRLGDNYCLGPDYFIQEITPKYLVPMHFGDNFEISHHFAEKMKDYPTKIISFNHSVREISLGI